MNTPNLGTGAPGERRVPDPMNPRLAHLLSDRALGELTPGDEAELQRLLQAAGTPDDFTFDLAAASLSLTDARILERAQQADNMPASLRAKLHATGLEFVSAPASRGLPRAIPSETFRPAPRPLVRPFSLGWVAAAACLLLAVGAWWNSPTGRPSATKPSSQLQTVAAAADAVRTTWQEWDNPEIKGVTGEIVWSSQLQKGVMVFKNLPKNDPHTFRYQLWIVDERGMDQRISGGIFDAFAGGLGNAEELPDGSLCVPIDAKHAIKRAAAFALTIEEPQGTWVSNMKRRIVIATRKN